MITFSWNSVPNATAYSVAWAPTLSGNKKILVASQAATSYSFDGSHVDDPYYVNRDTYMFVRALDGSNYVSSDWASVVMQMREVSIAGSHISSTLAIGDYRVVVGTTVPSFTITPDKGYQLTAEDISIVNNGVDITSQVYNANTHTVSSFVVNGSVQVLATAVQAQLAAPVISLSGSIVSWAAIPDAESYKLYVNGQFTANLGNELSVDLSQVIALKVPYTVNVLAHASGFKDSELSNTISYTPKPDAPVLTLNGNILSWVAIPSATKYTLVAISNSLSLSKTKTVDANTTSLDLTTWTDLVPSSWTIGAIAYVGDVRSDTSDTVTYVNTIQLAYPETVNISGNVLTWNNVANNSGYEILYRRVNGTGEIYQTDIVDTDITQHTLTVTTAGSYSITVVTIGTGSYTDSEESPSVTYTVQNKLATPTIAIDGNTLNITDVENAQKYKIYANGELKTTIPKGSTQTTYDLTNLNLSAGNYAITVVAEAEGFTDSDVSNSVNYTVQAQLATPTIAMNADGKTLEITDVENATSYDVYVDGTLKINVQRVTGYTVTFASDFSSIAYAGGELSDVTLTANTGVSTPLTSTARGLVWQGVSNLISSRSVALGISYTDASGANKSFNNYLALTSDITITYANDTCLTGDTLITLADGTTKRIDTITLADRVLAYNPETMALEADEIIRCDSDKIKTHSEYDVWTFSDGTIIKTVHRHRFYNVERNAMVYMDEWKIGEHGRKKDGVLVTLVSHENVKETVNHYTIFTKKQNYFANGLLSGNRYTKPIVFANDGR
nr:MAG TPA: Hint (Hedgehog/Intein) domain N-terminal region [Caudoviricetes sp.]